MSIQEKFTDGGSGIGYTLADGDRSAPLLFIHGAGSDSRLFIRQLRAFEGKRCAAALDLPAHGRSKLPGVPSLDDYLDAVRRVMNAEGWNACIPAGHSMGGGVALELLRRSPEKVVGLVLMATGAVLPVSDLVFDLLDRDYPSFCKFLVKFSYSRDCDEAVSGIALRQLLEADPLIAAADFRICSGFDFSGLLRKIEVPVLILGNEKDRMVPPSVLTGLHEGIRGSVLRMYPLEGHMPFFENAGQVNDDIRAFLNRGA